MRLILAVILTLLIAPTSESSETRHEFEGKVLDILAAESQNNTNTEQLMLFYVDGFNSAEGCYVAQSTGHVTLKVRNNDQGKFQASVVLSAFLTGKAVFVRVNSNNKDGNNYCYLEQVRLKKGL